MPSDLTFRAPLARVNRPSRDGRILVWPGPLPAELPPPTFGIPLEVGYFKAVPTLLGRRVGEIYRTWLSASGKLCVTGEFTGTLLARELGGTVKLGFTGFTFDVDDHDTELAPNPLTEDGAYYLLRGWRLRRVYVSPIVDAAYDVVPPELNVDLRDTDRWIGTREVVTT